MIGGGWPPTRDELVAAQLELGRATPPVWTAPQGRPPLTAGCFICHARGKVGRGARGDRCWAAAALGRGRSLAATAVVEGEAGGPLRARPARPP